MPAIDLDDPIFGIDISHHNVVDWDVLRGAKNLSFVWMKATEGSDFPDTKFIQNAEESKRLAIPSGAYHFARPDNNKPEKEADWFMERLEQAGGADSFELRPVLDYEVAAGNEQWIRTWLDRVESGTGQRPVLYTGPNVLGQIGALDADFETLLWMPRYPNNKTQTLSLDSQAVQLYATVPIPIASSPALSVLVSFLSKHDQYTRAGPMIRTSSALTA